MVQVKTTTLKARYEQYINILRNEDRVDCAPVELVYERQTCNAVISWMNASVAHHRQTAIL